MSNCIICGKELKSNSYIRRKPDGDLCSPNCVNSYDFNALQTSKNIKFLHSGKAYEVFNNTGSVYGLGEHIDLDVFVFSNENVLFTSRSNSYYVCDVSDTDIHLFENIVTSNEDTIEYLLNVLTKILKEPEHVIGFNSYIGAGLFKYIMCLSNNDNINNVTKILHAYLSSSNEKELKLSISNVSREPMIIDCTTFESYLKGLKECVEQINKDVNKILKPYLNMKDLLSQEL